MNIYDTLENYNISSAQRMSVESNSYEPVLSDNPEPYNIVNVVLKLTANIYCNVNCSKFHFSTQFFDITSNDVSWVIFEMRNGTYKVSLMDITKVLQPDCLVEFNSTKEITEEYLNKFNITKNHLEVLKSLTEELIKSLLKDETIIKLVV